MILHKDILLLSVLPKGRHCTECQRSNQCLLSAGSHLSAFLLQNRWPKPHPLHPHQACKWVGIMGLLHWGLQCLLASSILPTPLDVPTNCANPHVLIWQNKHQEWGTQTAHEIHQASPLDKYLKLTLQHGPSLLWSWLCNQKPHRFQAVLCCVQSDGRAATPVERTWWDNH